MLWPLKPRWMIVDVSNISHYEIDIFDFEHFKAGFLALTRWKELVGYEFKLVADLTLPRKVPRHQRAQVRKLIDQGVIELPETGEADPLIQKHAQVRNGAVATNDHFRDRYDLHPWLLEQQRIAAPVYSNERGWRWRWLDVEKHLKWFYPIESIFGGLADDYEHIVQPTTRKLLWELELSMPGFDSGIKSSDERGWPAPDDPVRVRHLARDLGLPWREVAEEILKLGIAVNGMGSRLTDDEVLRIRATFGYDGKRAYGHTGSRHPLLDYISEP